MAQDTVDAVIRCKSVDTSKIPTSEPLNSEMSGYVNSKAKGRRVIKCLINRLRLKRYASADISEPDPTYKVAYLGNVVTGWAKGEGCVEKPLATLWRNYTQSSRPDVRMQLCVSGGGLKANTKDHGLTEYWAHRLTYCAAPAHFPRIFCWVYRHEGRRLRHELRCHAVLCSTSSVARQLETQLKMSLAMALAEFKKDKLNKQRARLSLVNSVYENPTIPRRKILLCTGSSNYRPPLERSKSAPKLTIIEENLEEEEEIFEGRPRMRSETCCVDTWRCNALQEKFRADIEYPSETLNDTLLKERLQTKVRFSDEYELSSEDIVELNSAFHEELLESCKANGWFGEMNEMRNLLDSDEGSLSSGCESASTVTSDLDQPCFSTIVEDDGEDDGRVSGGVDGEKARNRLSERNDFDKQHSDFDKRHTDFDKERTDFDKQRTDFDKQRNDFDMQSDSDKLSDFDKARNVFERADNKGKSSEKRSDKSSERKRSEGKVSDWKLSEGKLLEWKLPEGSLLEKVIDSLGNERAGKVKPEVDFKVGGCVSRLSDLERSIHKFCIVKNLNNNVLENDEVSLVPLGESETDFSSLRVYKKKFSADAKETNVAAYEDEENGSACSDESGYDEVIDCASSIGNIVSV